MKGEMMELSGTQKFLLQGEIGPFLRERGIPIGDSTVDKLCVPASVAEGKGPPVDFYWNRRPLRKPETVLTWATGRLRPARQTAQPNQQEESTTTAA
jgi:hypothetical protein